MTSEEESSSLSSEYLILLTLTTKKNMWYHVIDWADQETVMSVNPAAQEYNICISSYTGLNHHFEVVDKAAFFDELDDEQLVEEISASKAKELIKDLALESIEMIFANDLD